ncbi:Transcriptional coactivator/pterin dehydratase [Macleaya cordata]|uniref:4a-hydroxytetrahydrobiopterin dehydratase n=1 Tax=Macleaya cordata TaxID=56857 RepID=A0A200QM70_MACCD|nr:Transcriptional coactivator/pterin dehydratase [Macleaya cordata]
MLSSFSLRASPDPPRRSTATKKGNIFASQIKALNLLGSYDVVGGRLVDDAGGLRLQCLWKLRDFKCGIELINRIFNVAEAAGHYPNLHLEQPNQVRAELWTASIGKERYLTFHDFLFHFSPY